MSPKETRKECVNMFMNAQHMNSARKHRAIETIKKQD